VAGRAADRDHRRHPARGRALTVRCAQCLVLGDTVQVALEVGGEATLHFNVPVHVARRNGVEPGARLRVSLLSEGIHLMRPRSHQ